MNTPVMDKFNLHPVGGYCTCASRKYVRCAACSACDALAERWSALSPEDKAEALEEAEQARQQRFAESSPWGDYR